jgi:hypothetical protein
MRTKRPVRPTLERTKPIRSWTNAVSVGPDPSGDQVGDNVRNANRVIEEYLSAGRASAQRFAGANGLGGPSGSVQDLGQSMLRALSDSVSLWLEFMARSMGAGTPPPRPSSPPADTSAAPSTESHGGLRVAVEVESTRPTTVAVDLRPDVRGADLCVDRLHPRHRAGAPLTGVEIESTDAEIPRIRLRIDPEHPPGVYDGVIVHKVSSLPAGTISVDIRPGNIRPGRRKARGKGAV